MAAVYVKVNLSSFFNPHCIIIVGEQMNHLNESTKNTLSNKRVKNNHKLLLIKFSYLGICLSPYPTDFFS